MKCYNVHAYIPILKGWRNKPRKHIERVLQRGTKNINLKFESPFFWSKDITSKNGSTHPEPSFVAGEKNRHLNCPDAIYSASSTGPAFGWGLEQCRDGEGWDIMSSFSFMMNKNHLFDQRKFFSLIYLGKIILTCIYIYCSDFSFD